MVFGLRRLLRGVWCMVLGAWCLVRGVYCVVFSAWCFVRGCWCLIFCAWAMVFVARCMVIGACSFRCVVHAATAWCMVCSVAHTLVFLEWCLVLFDVWGLVRGSCVGAWCEAHVVWAVAHCAVVRTNGPAPNVN